MYVPMGILLALLVSAELVGCGHPDDTSDIVVSMQVEPEVSPTGNTTVSIMLTDSTGQPIRNAGVTVEATMTHPGMPPTSTDATPVAPGQYQGTLNLTMAGDWILFLQADLPDGRILRRQRELHGVNPR